MKRLLGSIGMVMAAGVMVAAAGCSSDSSTPTPAGTTAAPKMTKAQVIEKGDKICAAGTAKNKALAEPKSAADIEPYFKQSLAILRGEIAEIKALGPPDTDADKLNAALAKATTAYDNLEKKLPQIVENPSLVTTDKEISEQVDAAAAEAKAFGFKVCGQDSASGGGSTTTKK